MITALLPLASKIVSGVIKRIPDKAQQAKLDAEKDMMAMKIANELESDMRDQNLKIIEGQSAINLADAQTGGWFRAGWRPLIGWGCSLAIVTNILVFPIIDAFNPDFVRPEIDTGLALSLLVPLLGLGGMRSWEKTRK